MKLRKRKLIWLGTVGVFCSMPFVWVDIWSINTLTLKPIHLAFIALTAINIVAYPRELLRSLSNFWVLAVILFGSAHVLWMLLATQWGYPVYGFIAKQAIHLVFFLVIANSIAVMLRCGELRTATLWGAALGMVCLLIWWTAVFGALGKNLWAEYFGALLRRDTIALQFKFYDPLFNCSLRGQCVASLDSDALRDSVRITLLGSYVFYFIALLTFFRSFQSVPMRAIAGLLISTCALLTVLTISRAAILGLGATLIVPVASRLLSNGIRVRRVTMFFLPVIGVVVSAIVLSQIGSSAADIVGERVSEISNDPRIDTMASAWRTWSSPIFGEGVGSTVATSTGQTFGIHHFLLKAIFETGMIGGILAMGWFIAIAALAVQVFTGDIGINRSGARGLVAAAAAFPLIRLQVGAIGMPTLQEWIALSLLFGFVLAYRGTAHLPTLSANFRHSENKTWRPVWD
jgi:O-antigen ligase